MNLRKAAVRFFDEFEKEHNASRDIVKEIEIICNAINEALEKFTAKNYYRQSSKQIQNDIKEFVKRFFEQHLKTLNFLNRLANKIDVLLEMADCFTYSHNLPCDKHCTGTRCEADLNKLRCEIAEFFDALIKIGKEAKNHLQGIENGCNILGDKSRKFSGKNHLDCSSCDIDDSRLLNNVRNFLNEFEAVFNKAKQNFKDLADICNALAKTIDDWQKKLK